MNTMIAQKPIIPTSDSNTWFLFSESQDGNKIAIAGTTKDQNKIMVNKFHPTKIENGIKTAAKAIGTINVPVSFFFSWPITKYNDSALLILLYGVLSFYRFFIRNHWIQNSFKFLWGRPNNTGLMSDPLFQHLRIQQILWCRLLILSYCFLWAGPTYCYLLLKYRYSRTSPFASIEPWCLSSVHDFPL